MNRRRPTIRSFTPSQTDESSEAISRREMAETRAIRTRQGDVIVRATDGITRIATADAVTFAFGRGKLGGMPVPAERLLEIGTLYKKCFEAVSGLLTAPKNEIRGSGGGGVQESVIAAGQTLATLRARQSPLHLEVLNAVCGQDATTHRVALNLHRRRATVEEQLREGLVTAAHNWGYA